MDLIVTVNERIRVSIGWMMSPSHLDAPYSDKFQLIILNVFIFFLW